MTLEKNQLGDLLTLLQGAYPGFKVADGVAFAWWTALKGENHETLIEAAQEYMRSQTRLPTPAGLLSTAAKLREARMAQEIEKSRENAGESVPGFAEAPDDGTSHYRRWLKAMAAGDYSLAQRILDAEELEDLGETEARRRREMRERSRETRGPRATSGVFARSF